MCAIRGLTQKLIKSFSPLSSVFAALFFSTWSFHAHKGYITAVMCVSLTYSGMFMPFFRRNTVFTSLKKKVLFAYQTSAYVKNAVGVFKNSNRDNSFIYSIHFILCFSLSNSNFWDYKKEVKDEKRLRKPCFYKKQVKVFILPLTSVMMIKKHHRVCFDCWSDHEMTKAWLSILTDLTCWQ